MTRSEISCVQMDQMTLAMVCAALGVIVALAGFVMVLVAAFKKSFVWFLCCLLLPGAKIVFCFLHWEEAKAGAITYCLGLVICYGGFHSFAGPEFHPQVKVSSTKSSGNQLFEQKQQKLAEISQMKSDIAGMESQLTQQYLQLSDRRKALKTSDQGAVQGFNVAAAAYTKANQDLADKRAELSRLWKELEVLTNESERIARAESVQVVLYTTSWCPACRQAKEYLRSNAIPYEEKDVESSQTAAQEFQSLGGGGVPLVVVKGHRMTGFSAQWVQQMLAEN